MLLYLHSLEQNGSEKYGEIEPSGILYMPATTPIISAEKDISADKLEKEFDSALKMNGLLLNDVEVIKGMDKSVGNKYIPYNINKGRTTEHCLATLEQLGGIFKKLDLTVAQMGEDLYGGNIQASPIKGVHDACEYCPYDSVCTYRQSECRNSFDKSNFDVYNRIKKELEERGDEYWDEIGHHNR